MTISSPGVGSNLDVNSIVSQLLSLDKRPIALLDAKTASFQSKLSAYGILQSSLQQFQTALAGLTNQSAFQSVKATIADSTIASLTATAKAAPGTYSLETSQLAQTQKLVAAGQTSNTAVIGSGAATTLTFDLGTISGGTFSTATGTYTGATFTSSGSGVKTLTIDSTNNSLSGIRDAINKAGVGVTATIVNDGTATPYRLAITSNATGATNSLKLSVSGDATLSALLSQDPAATQKLSETATAQNALFKLNGIAVSKTANIVTDAIDGVTLTLAKSNIGTPTNITIASDNTAATTAINSFVESFNSTVKTLAASSAYDPGSKQGAILNGDSTVRTIQSQISKILNAPVAGGASAFSRLSQIGVSVQKDGTLLVDSTKLQAALVNNPGDVAGLFSSVGKSSDALINFSTSTDKTLPGAYAITVTQLATKGNAAAYGVAGLTISVGVNDGLAVTVDGVSSTITLSAGTYASAAALATEIQSKINGSTAFSAAGKTVSVSQNAGVLAITSANYGSASAVTVTGGNGAANLKLDAGATFTAGLDVAGTINGVAASGSGQTLNGASGTSTEGLALLVSGGALGARGTVNYSQGYATQLNALTTSLLATTSSISARKDGINASLRDIQKSKDTLNNRLIDVEKRYRAQFTALDQVIGNLSKTSQFLTQQLANLPKPF